MFSCLEPTCNLMGGILVSPMAGKMIDPCIYAPEGVTEETIAKDMEAAQLTSKLFRQEIVSQEKGWVDVIPYNENLIFLKGADGAYDYVVRGMKNHKFEHQIYSPFLKRISVPSHMNELYDFKRWFYFDYKGWQELDEHRAEQYFYARGGQSSSYPGELSILQRYLTDQNFYSPKKGLVARGVMNCPLQFHKIQAGRQQHSTSCFRFDFH